MALVLRATGIDDRTDRNTPSLILAVANEHVDCLQVLIDAQENLDNTDFVQKTALITA